MPTPRIHPAHRRGPFGLLAALIVLEILAPARAHAMMLPLRSALAVAAPSIDPLVLQLALEAHDRALERGLLPEPDVLTVIDYSRPSVEPRFWVFDLAARRLVFEELVAHGRNSGDTYATQFSNEESSLETSLGLFVTRDVYVGKHGRSLRLDGLEPGFNDQAAARAIVIHGSDYVSAALAARDKVGRSWGCPALAAKDAAKVIDRIRDGSAVFAYYPDSSWIRGSLFLQGTPADTSAPAEFPAATRLGHGVDLDLAYFNVSLLQWVSGFVDRYLQVA